MKKHKFENILALAFTALLLSAANVAFLSKDIQVFAVGNTIYVDAAKKLRGNPLALLHKKDF
jgi:myo-inositol catabolism protein IolC